MSETILKTHQKEEVDSNQLQLVEPSYEEQDVAVKKEVLVARTLVRQKNGQGCENVADLKKSDQRLQKGNVMSKFEPVLSV